MATTTRQQNKAAGVQLRKKIILERKLQTKMQSFLKKQTDSFFASYRPQSKNNDLDDSNAELTRLLRAHYWKAADVFVPTVLEEVNAAVKLKKLDKIKKDDPLIEAALLLFIGNAVSESVPIIQRKQLAIINGKIASTETLQDARKQVQAANVSRSKAIASFENQNAVEGIKHAAGRTIPAVVRASAAVRIVVRQKKTWVAIIDTATRPLHVSANGLSVDIDEPFKVGGEFLMYPGDTAMGATAKNVAYCRCVSLLSTVIL